jgi:hypothetical protein
MGAGVTAMKNRPLTTWVLRPSQRKKAGAKAASTQRLKMVWLEREKGNK